MALNITGPWQFNPPKEFSGKKEDFEEFAFKLKAYLSIMNSDYAEDLRRIEENMDTEIIDAHFNDASGDPIPGLRDRATTLQWILVALCSGAASLLLRRETSTNGFESWRRLCQKYKLPSRARAVGRLSKILKPDFSGANTSFEDSLAAWEDEVAKYERETSTSLSDDVKFAVMMNETHGHLQEHLRLNAASLTRYSEIKDVIVNYFKSRQIFNVKDPMQVDGIWGFKGYKGKKGKGKGKGKGKDNFKGQKGSGKGDSYKGKK